MCLLCEVIVSPVNVALVKLVPVKMAQGTGEQMLTEWVVTVTGEQLLVISY